MILVKQMAFYGNKIGIWGLFWQLNKNQECNVEIAKSNEKEQKHYKTNDISYFRGKIQELFVNLQNKSTISKIEYILLVKQIPLAFSYKSSRMERFASSTLLLLMESR